MAMRTSGAERERGRGAAMLLVLITASLTPCPSASAQQPASPRPWYVPVSHWARWPTLAVAAGLTAAAIFRKDDADAVYDQLQSLCRADSQQCILTPDGTYVNPDAEALYQETLRLDGQARRWMVGGQVALVISGGMFLIDLVAGHTKPKNIPLTPFEVYSTPRALGLRWRY